MRLGAARTLGSAKSRRALIHALAVLLLGLLVAIAFRDVIGSDRGLFARDHTLVFRRRWSFVWASFRALELPVFDPIDPTGVPFEALLNATYTPTSLLFFAKDFDVVYDLHVVLVLWVLGSGVYLLANALGARTKEALLSAFVAMLSGPVLSFENLLIGLQGLAYAPWVYWALLMLLKRQTVPRAGVLAITVGFHLQGIMPEVLLLDLLAAAAIFLFTRPRIGVRLIVLGLLGGALGFGIAAIELMPVLEILPSTARGRGFSYESMSPWSLVPAQLIELIAPAFWSPPESPMIRIPSINGERGYPYLTTMYFGSALALAAAALGAKTSRRAMLALFGVAALGVVLAFGPSTPVHPQLVHVPILKSGRYPVKYLLLTSAAIAAIAPMAWRSLERSFLPLLVSGAVQAVIAGSLLLSAQSSEFADWLQTVLRDDAEVRFAGITFKDYPAIAQSAMELRLEHALAASIAVALVAACGLIVPRSRSVAASAICALVGLDLAWAGGRAIIGASVEPRGPPAPIMARLRNPHHRVFTLLPNGFSAPFGKHGGRTHLEDELISERLRGQAQIPGVRALYYVDLDASTHPVATAAFSLFPKLTDTRAHRLLARFGTAWILTPLPQEQPGVISFDVPGEIPEHLVPLPARPYVSAYTRWTNVVMKQTTLQDLAHLLTDRDAADEALVFDSSQSAGPIATSTACAPTRATLLPGSTPARIELETESLCPTVAVVLETAMPGWEARVDGEPRRIIPAELGYIGTEVPPGRHRIEVSYAPRIRRWLPVSVGCFVLALAMSLAGLALSARVL